jgi:hypothetical protein
MRALRVYRVARKYTQGSRVYTQIRPKCVLTYFLLELSCSYYVASLWLAIAYI